jgi:hypothetical protein
MSSRLSRRSFQAVQELITTNNNDLIFADEYCPKLVRVPIQGLQESVWPEGMASSCAAMPQCTGISICTVIG